MLRHAAVAFCVALFGYPLSNVYSASSTEELKRAATHIASAEQELTDAKASASETFKMLQSGAIEASEQSDKWAHLADLEGDARMKAIDYEFRDVFANHSKVLSDMAPPLRDLAQIGEKLEVYLKLLRALQADLERIGRDDAEPDKTRSALTIAQGLDLALGALKQSVRREPVPRTSQSPFRNSPSSERLVQTRP